MCLASRELKKAIVVTQDDLAVQVSAIIISQKPIWINMKFMNASADGRR